MSTLPPSCERRTTSVAVSPTGTTYTSMISCFFFSSRRRHTRFDCDWSSDVCSSDLEVELGAFGPVQELDTHSPQLGVDVGIVDDFADQEQPAVGELGAGLIGVLDGAVHTVAEAELARELERQITERERVPLGADPIHHPAVVVGHQRASDVALEAEAAPEIGLLHGVNLTGRLGRRARRPSHAAPPNRRGRWRPLPWRAALPARRRDPA